MNQVLSGKRVAIFATDGFEQSELLEPKKALEEAGAKTVVVSLKHGEIKGWKDQNWAQPIKVDKTIDEVSIDDFDALVLPGGVINSDRLRADEDAVDFVRAFVEEGKAVGAICHGPWLLVEADVVAGKRMTSWISLRTDLVNAGAQWVDSEVEVDEGLVTSRKPADIPAFSNKLIGEIVGNGTTWSNRAKLM